MFRDRDLIFFVDNMTTLKICVNGYDRHSDIVHLSNTIHLALAGLSNRVYFEWVPWKANPVYLSSRTDFIVYPVTSLLVLDTRDFTDKDRTVIQKLDDVHVPMVLPQVHQLDNLSLGRMKKHFVRAILFVELEIVNKSTISITLRVIYKS